MRQWITAITLTLAALAGTAPPAAGMSAAAGPVTAIQRQLVKGHGVKINERHTFNDGFGWDLLEPTKGMIGFGNGKVLATDLRDYNSAKNGTRYICIGKRGWQYSPEILPAGKTWFTYDSPCKLSLAAGPVVLDEPATLKAVLATATTNHPAGVYDGTRTTLYEGTITFAQLHKANPTRTTGFWGRQKYASWKVSWRLWIGRDQLVRRAWTKWRQPETKEFEGVTHGQGWFGFVNDVRLSDWGAKVDIQPPPVDQTANRDEISR